MADCVGSCGDASGNGSARKRICCALDADRLQLADSVIPDRVIGGTLLAFGRN